jgi:hypothetical protein
VRAAWRHPPPALHCLGETNLSHSAAAAGNYQDADRLQPALNIEKALLPHDPLAPSAHDRVRSPIQIRGELARGIFRGALPVIGKN